jgi:hypothetical protein
LENKKIEYFQVETQHKKACWLVYPTKENTFQQAPTHTRRCMYMSNLYSIKRSVNPQTFFEVGLPSGKARDLKIPSLKI